MEFLDQFQIVALSSPERGGRPLPDTVHRQDGGLLEGGGEERARRVGLVMLGVEDLPVIAERLAKLPVHEQFFLDPERPGLEKREEALRSHAEVGFEYPFELEQRLVVEADIRQVFDRDPGRAEAVLDRVPGEARVPLLPRETLLLRGGDDLAVGEETGGAVMVEGGDSENVHAGPQATAAFS